MTHKLINQILINYNLGSLSKFSKFDTGTVQTNILLETQQGKHVLRLYRQNRCRESILFEVDLIKFLNLKKYPCPKIIVRKSGDYVGQVGDINYVIFSFEEGIHLEQAHWNQKQELIYNIAKLHKLTSGFDSKYKEARLNYTIKNFRKLVFETAQKLATKSAQDKLKWYYQELDAISIPPALPKGICHCDFHFSNILYKDGKFNSLIDFDDANLTYQIFDLVCLVEEEIYSFTWSNWSNPADQSSLLNFQPARNIIEAYEEIRPLKEIEKLHFYDLLKFNALVDCVWYYERGSLKDNFYEKFKIDLLNTLGREQFYQYFFES